jgi:hypothetical protein
MSVGSVLEAARRRGVPAARAFQTGGYDKARYSPELDREGDRLFFQNNAKKDYIEQIFRWRKEGVLRDGGHFLAQIPALLKLSGDITAKQAADLRRILSKYLAAQPGLAADPQYTRLEQYLDTRRKITGEVKSVIFSMANSLTKTMDRKSAFKAAWRAAAAGLVKAPAAGSVQEKGEKRHD